MAAGRYIVVGVDGSETSLEALRWARDECRRRDCALRVVTCWTYPVLIGMAAAQAPISGAELELDARAVGEAAVEKVLGSDQDVQVGTDVLEGPPSLKLLEYDHTAEMIVIGSRGRGGFAGLLLGSVSQHLAEHARCPVLVVHHPPAP